MESRKERSPWVYVGLGCGCLGLVVVAVFAALLLFGYRTLRNWQATIEDPARRAGAVQEMLGYDTLPDGYVPTIGIEIPLVMRIAVLSNVPYADVGHAEQPLERAFFYVRVSEWIKRDDDLGPVFDGAGDPSRIFNGLDESNLRLRGGEPIGSGTVVVRGRSIPYAAERGEIDLDERRLDGIVAAFVVKCDGGNDGLGGWIVADPAPGAPIAEVDLGGTPADPAALATFLSRFDLCR